MVKDRNRKKELTRPKGISRREVIKGLSTIPFMGAFAAAWFRKGSVEQQLKEKLLEAVNLTA